MSSRKRRRGLDEPVPEFMNAEGVRNWYEYIPTKFKDKPRHYDSEKQVKIKLPARMIFIGTTGSGKTNALMELYFRMNCFDRVYLYCKVQNEPFYAWLKDLMQKAEDELKYQIFWMSDDLSSLPPATSHDPELNTLVIFDDMMNEKNALLKRVTDYWTLGRKCGISPWFLSQAYFTVPLDIRRNTPYVVFTKIQTNRDLTSILKDYQLGLTDEQIMAVYHEATQEGFPHFLMIDLETKNPYWRYRKDWQPIPMEKLHHLLGDMAGSIDGLAIKDVKPIKGKKRKLEHDDDEKSDLESDHEERDKDITIQAEQKVRPVANIRKPRVQSQSIPARLARLARLTHNTVAQLKQTAKSCNLTLAQLCDELEIMYGKGS